MTSTPRDHARYGMREDGIGEAAHSGSAFTLSLRVGETGINRFLTEHRALSSALHIVL